MLRLKDINANDFIKINNMDGLGVKKFLIERHQLKEKYKVYKVVESSGDNIGAIAIEVNELDDGRVECGIIFEDDLKHIELIK